MHLGLSVPRAYGWRAISRWSNNPDATSCQVPVTSQVTRLNSLKTESNSEMENDIGHPFQMAKIISHELPSKNMQ